MMGRPPTTRTKVVRLDSDIAFEIKQIKRNYEAMGIGISDNEAAKVFLYDKKRSMYVRR